MRYEIDFQKSQLKGKAEFGTHLDGVIVGK